MSDLPRCQNCNEILQQEWDNVGFEEPDPTHYEVTWYCPNCGDEE